MYRDPYDESVSSPLTSLSSFDEESEISDQNLHDGLYSIEDIEAAQVPFPSRDRIFRLRDTP